MGQLSPFEWLIVAGAGVAWVLFYRRAAFDLLAKLQPIGPLMNGRGRPPG